MELTGSSVATFLTSESGISAINFMPVTPEEKSARDKGREIRQRTQHTMTNKDDKNTHKTPRMPPLRYKYCLQLYTTYAVLFEMFFTPNNGHLKGLSTVQGQLREVSQQSSNLTRRYLAYVTWAILDDGFFYFLEAMLVSKLEGKPMLSIIFP